MKKNYLKGFTLLELMIAVAVIAVIAAIAVPSYKQYILKSRRSDARAALLGIQLAEEKWRANNIAYTSTLSDINWTAASPDGHYSLSLSDISATTYTITADPVGDQAKDSDCDPMTVDETGDKTPAACW